MAVILRSSFDTFTDTAKIHYIDKYDNAICIIYDRFELKNYSTEISHNGTGSGSLPIIHYDPDNLINTDDHMQNKESDIVFDEDDLQLIKQLEILNKVESYVKPTIFK